MRARCRQAPRRVRASRRSRGRTMRCCTPAKISARSVVRSQSSLPRREGCAAAASCARTCSRPKAADAWGARRYAVLIPRRGILGHRFDDMSEPQGTVLGSPVGSRDLWTKRIDIVGPSPPQCRFSRHAVLDAAGDPALRQHLDLHPPATRRAIPRRLELAAAFARAMVAGVGRLAAPIAVLAHNVFDSSLIGIWSSSSSAKSSLGSRPRVVR
jgi:hypothetical protein